LLHQMHGRYAETMEEYVAWSQQNQYDRLLMMARMTKARFPAIGGVLLWGSHDTFPMLINGTVIDFDGNPKPAVQALRRVWRDDAILSP